MVDLFNSDEQKFQKERNYKKLYQKNKSFIRALTQELFLKLLLKLFPNKFSSYKNKIKYVLNRSGYFLNLYTVSTYLRFRYPFYFMVPSRHLYAVGITIKILKICKLHKIDIFLAGGSLLGAIRQGSYAGRPRDLDFGIKEEDLPKLLDSISLLKKNGARFIRRRPYNKIERLQIAFPCILVDIGIYRKQNEGEKIMWTNFGGERENDYLIHVQGLINSKKWDHSQKHHSIPKKNLTNNRFGISLDPLIAVEFYGIKLMAPPHPEIYLEKKYGKNWRIPDKKQFTWNKKEFK